MKKSSLLFVLVLSSAFQYLWAYDTLLFKSDFEERQIKQVLINPDHDFIALYTAISLDSAAYLRYKSEINSFYNYLNPKILIAKSGKQKAKLIFKEVHMYFFKKYEENVMFSEIFEEGIYNCVTASMLYSLVLKKFGIPYEIKEKPTHVYLVAYPGTDNILFETTSPHGLYVPDEKSKRDYVAGLVKMKFTTQEYVNSIGVMKAFNEFYYNNMNISLTQLAGLQYYNNAIALYTDGKSHEAIKSAVKMNMLYPCAKHQYMKATMIGASINNSEFTSLRDVLYLCEYANSVNDVKDKKYVVSVFGNIIDEVLYKTSNDTFVNKAYEIIKSRIEDEKILHEITYSYSLGMSGWYSMKGDMNLSLRFAEDAYLLNQSDVRLQDLIVRGIVLKTEKLKAKDRNIEALDEYAVKFPFLTKHKSYKMLRVYHLSLLCYSLFLENKGVDAYKYLTQLETELNTENEKMTGLEEMIGMVYAEAGAYHFRKKEYKTAIEVMRKGLEIAPDHGEIKERIRIVEDEMK